MRVHDCGNIFQSCAYLERNHEHRRQLRDAGADAVNSEQHVIVGACNDVIM